MRTLQQNSVKVKDAFSNMVEKVLTTGWIKSGLTIVQWMDNLVVSLAISLCGTDLISSVKKWNSNEKKTSVPCSNIVCQYIK